MRNDLKATAGVTAIKTDLDKQTCTFCVPASIDVKTLLDELEEQNNKFSEWKLTN